MIKEIRARATAWGITRLCHFTPSRNLPHILSDPRGILSTARLRTDERAVLNPTDLARYDCHPDHVCCSIQYPNAWYFLRAREKEMVFRDWVVLLVAPHHLWASGTKFCPYNAATGRGRGVAQGLIAYEAMFAPTVVGSQDRTYTRSAQHPPWLPTDEQAEVLVPDRVALGDVQAVAVQDEAQARCELLRLEALGVAAPPLVIAPAFFTPYRLSEQLRAGKVPREVPFDLRGSRE